MHEIAADDRRRFAAWFAPERPGGAMCAAHVARTGIGSFYADRLDEPRAVLAQAPGNAALRGDPGAVRPEALDVLEGFVDAPPEWLPVLRQADPGVTPWDRVMFELPAEVEVPERIAGIDARLLGPADTAAIEAFDADGAWIHKTWGGAAGMAGSGTARGVFVEDRLVSIAVAFFLGEVHEELGVVTDSAHRGRGYSRAASAALCADIRARGHVPAWTTSPDNAASVAVAERLGFRRVGTGLLYAVRVPIPPTE